MQISLEGKVALVTGASRGIGKAIAASFAGAGADVMLSSRKQDALEAAADDIGTAGGQTAVFAANAGEPDQIAACVAATVERFGRVDVLVNNAATNPYMGRAIDIDLPRFDKTWQVNYRGPVVWIQEAWKASMAEHGGSIINTASFVAVMGAATSQISYTASKGGVLAMTRELGVQFARKGIRVNALCPGPVNTPLLQELFAKDPERAARRLVHVPMGRFAEPEEIANAVAFLGSDESSFITAMDFLVDGGLSNAYVTPLDSDFD